MPGGVRSTLLFLEQGHRSSVGCEKFEKITNFQSFLKFLAATEIDQNTSQNDVSKVPEAQGSH